MRDSNAPIINGFDCSGLVNRYSLRCEQSFPERGDTARTLDGASQTDVFPRKIRLSWTLNSVTAQQFADFNAALDDSETINLVSAVAYDPTRDALCSGNFYVTRPAFPFALSVNGGAISQAGAELILDQQGALDWISVTPPNQLAYDIGDTFDSAGFRVTLTDDQDNVTDITSECSLSIDDGDLLPDSGNIPVSVTRNGVQIGAFAVSVSAVSDIIASGDWWTLYPNGFLDIYCVGDMPSQYQQEWKDYLKQITSVVIRDSVTSISYNAFANCSALTKVEISDSVTSIQERAFIACSALPEIKIPDTVTRIGAVESNSGISYEYYINHEYDGAFNSCTSLSSVALPASLTIIGVNAFANCSALPEIEIPDTVTRICAYAFYRCSAIKNLIIPDSVTRVGTAAFAYCGGITQIPYETLLRLGASTALTQRETAINVFRGTAVTSVTIPKMYVRRWDTMKGVYDTSSYGVMAGMFRECFALVSVTLNANTTYIGDCAFYGCSHLSQIIIPPSVKKIGYAAFKYTGLTEITISRDCEVYSDTFPSGCVINYYD